MFIYRDVVYNPETDDPGKTEILIRKQRNGPIGDIQLQFESQFTRFFAKSERSDAPPETNSPDFRGF
jgi:replicative DNA helicase